MFHILAQTNNSANPLIVSDKKEEDSDNLLENLDSKDLQLITKMMLVLKMAKENGVDKED